MTQEFMDRVLCQALDRLSDRLYHEVIRRAGVERRIENKPHVVERRKVKMNNPEPIMLRRQAE